MKPNVLIELMYMSIDDSISRTEDVGYMLCRDTTVTEAFSVIDNILENYNRIMNDEDYYNIDLKALKLLLNTGGYINGNELVRLRSDKKYFDLFSKYNDFYDYRSANERYNIAITDQEKDIMVQESDYIILIYLSEKFIIYLLHDSYTEEEYNSKFYDKVGVSIPEYKDIRKANMGYPKIPFQKWELAKQEIALNKYMISDDRVLVRPIYR